MAEEKSEASCYSSKYGGGYIQPGQFIAEIICERMAAKDKVTLPVKFWNTPKWKKVFLMQLMQANSLLKMYDDKAIIAGLKKNWRCYSLKAKWLDDDFKIEQAKLDELKKRDEGAFPANITLERTNTLEKPREAFIDGKSTKAKLRDLD